MENTSSPARPSVFDRIQALSSGKTVTAGAPVAKSLSNGELSETIAAPVQSAAPPRPGSFSAPVDSKPSLKETVAVVPVIAQPTAAQRIAALQASTTDKKAKLQELACMKTLTRMLEAVYTRPGSGASHENRMAALAELSEQSMALGNVLAGLAGENAERSAYVRAMSMDAAVTLVASSWKANQNVDWPTLVEASANTPAVSDAAAVLAEAVYRPVDCLASASDRLAVSTHAAFWQIIELGRTVDGVTPSLATEFVQRAAEYLNKHERFVENNDLQVAWMQGSIRRLTDLVCAELQARAQITALKDDPTVVDSVLKVCFSGFEGVEKYAQNILERPVSAPVSRPTGG